MVKRQKFDVRAIALVGICAATIECGKLALAAVPNFEVVTLLTALYGYAFGWVGVLSSVVFVCIEPLIYGINTWVVLYFIYWPLVALVFMLMRRAKIKNRWLITLVAVGLTVFFGVLSALIEIGLFSGSFDRFFYRFSIYYMRGIPFYVIQIVGNAVLFPLLFPYLSVRLERLGNKLLRRT
jgi:energy-coupling factor transport system substrate-specific component/cob(I)alamin adenosyltransferase